MSEPACVGDDGAGEGRTIGEMLVEVLELGVVLRVEGGELGVRAPRGVLGPELRERLKQHKAEVCELIGDGRCAAPCSYAQQGMWFLDQWESGTASYNIPVVVRLDGALDRSALGEALNAVIERHESLRTILPSAAGRPYQVVLPPLPGGTVRLALDDLTDAPAESREAAALDLAAAEVRQGFDLATGPLLRARLVRLDASRHLLVLTLHHVVADGWSVGVLIGELATLYAACRTSGASGDTAHLMAVSPSLAELPIRYADYSAWQRRTLDASRRAALLEHWGARLAGAPAVLDLPIDHPRPVVQSFRGALRPFVIPAEVMRGLDELARCHDATLFMVLLAAFDVLLARLSGATDLVVGSPIARRDSGEVEGLIGLFVNTLALRADLGGDPSFLELLEQVRGTVLDALANQELPFEMLVQHLEPQREPGRTPLFQVAFAMQGSSGQTLELADLRFEQVPMDEGIAKFDLTLFLAETPSGLEGAFEHCTDLLEADTVDRMIGHLQTLLVGICDHPELPVSRLPLLSAVERQRLVDGWNNTNVDYPRQAVIHELLEAQVDRAPGATALRLGDDELSYGELDRRANRLARHLAELGVGRGALVGLCLERSFELVVATVAILKAGAAYVPLDPDSPVERLRLMLEDTAAPVVITRRGLCERLGPSGARLVLLEPPAGSGACEPAGTLDRAGDDQAHDDPAHRPGAWSAERLELRGAALEAAYVMYTSGSTGRPKGVVVPHRAVVRLVRGADYAEMDSDQVFLQMATFCFDAATFELWGGLLNGAQVVLLPPGRPTVDQLGEVIREQQVSIIFLTTGLFHLMVEHGLEHLAGLGQLLAGGEVNSVDHVRTVVEQLPSCRMIAVYGPTENTTFTTSHRVEDAASLGRSVPIGRPISSTTVYLLSGSMEPVPIGVVGELYAGGDGLALEYLARPALTAERLVPDPFSSEPGARLYRTGDLARYLPDGTIDFVGRVDSQVKLRGFRIEPGEIEVALLAHPGVAEAAVGVVEHRPREHRPSDKQPSDRRLVAWVVPEAAGAIRSGGVDAAGLRSYLAGRLPEYMVPAAIVLLEAMPLNANGKVDRRALPEPRWEIGSQGSTEASQAPRGRVQELLAELWAEVLGLDRVGIEDDFFELGGHSLLATQLVSRVRAHLGVALPLRTLFEAPTVAALAARLDIEPAGSGPEEPPLVPVPRVGDLPLSFSQQRLWFIDQWEHGSPFYNVPVAMRLRGLLEVDVLHRALEEIVRRHEALRTTFGQAEDGRPVQRISDEESLALPVIELAAGRGGGEAGTAGQPEQLQAVLEAEATRRFDLERGPLLRALVVRLGPDDHVLSLCLHHIVTDMWSLGILVGELAELYPAFRYGEASPLPDLPVQYPDVAVWQRRVMSGARLEQELAYWRGQLAGAPEVLELPADRPRPARQSFVGSVVTLELDRILRSRLEELARSQGATLFMILLAVFDLLLARWTGQHDVVVGSPVANRTRAETEPLIGFFLNTLALRTRLDDNPSGLDLLARVREMMLEADAHQHLPFELLVEALEPRRDPSRTPVFQIMFTLQNAPIPRLEVGGLELEPLAAGTETAKFDLTLLVAELDQGLGCTFEYATDLYDAATIGRLAGHYRTLLESIVADPHRPVLDLPMLGPEEMARLLGDWSRGEPAPAPECCVHDLVREAAAIWPEAVAVEEGEATLSYEEMLGRADELAARLSSAGVGADVPVALLAPRGIELVVGVLGILAAGGACVPLDLELPPGRLGFILEDSGAVAVVIGSGLTGTVACEGVDRLGLPEVPIAADPAQTRPEPQGHWASSGPSSLAYVIYTSGSTGRPKGVGMEHRGLVNLVRWQLSHDEHHRGGRTLQLSSIGFDVSFQEIFTTLAAGGTLVTLSEEVRRDPAALLQLLDAARIERLFLPFVALQQLARAAVGLEPPLVPACLVEIVTAGEQLETTAALRQWFRAMPGCALHNHYGPTESHVVTALRLPDEVDTWEPLPAIGRPLAGITVRVLDPRLEPVPIGVVGQLCLAGLGLARGYLGRPALTAERFVPDPWPDRPDRPGRPGQRLYLTGDLARFRADGALQLLGRIDHQVKIRGHRVELGEIEAALSATTQVREVAVVACPVTRPGGLVDTVLVAHVVPAEPGLVDPRQLGPGGLDTSRLREALQRDLPAHMIPAVFLARSDLPLTTTGKVDRLALMAAAAAALDEATVADRAQGAAKVEPTDELEAQLLDLFEQTLGAHGLGITDSFFERGGHSLLAVHLCTRVRAELGLTLNLTTLFHDPTVAGVAAALRQGLPGSGAAASTVEPGPVVQLTPGDGTAPPLLLVYPSGGGAACYASLVRRLDPALTVWGLQSPGLADQHQTCATIDQMAAFYLEQARTIQPAGPYRLGGWSMGGLVAYDMARHLVHAGDEVELLVLLDAHVPAAGSGTTPPEHGADRSAAAELDLLAGFAWSLGLDPGRDPAERRLVEAMTSTAERLAYLLERLHREHQAPDSLDLDRLSEMLDLYRANIDLLRAWDPRPYRGAVHLLRAAEALEGALPDGGWSPLVGRLEVHEVPGGHFTMLREPAVADLATCLQHCLDRGDKG